MKQCVVLLLALLLPVVAFSQPDTVNVPSDYGVGEGSLNTAVTAAITAGTLSNTVFKLEPYGLYILSGTISVPLGSSLTIVAPTPGNTQETAPPQIVWTSTGGVTTAFIFDCYGNITLKNVWILYANTGGTQVGSSIQIQDTPDSINGQHGTFENVIFDYGQTPNNASGCVGVTAAHARLSFKNCYFRNCMDTHLRYYGRAVSFPFGTTGWHIDSVAFEHCTFANLGYVYMQEGNEYGDYVSFNHCTFLNIMMYTLESTWWHRLVLTNNLFVNAYMFGDIEAQRNGATDAYGGTVNFDSISTFGFSVPFTEQERHVLFTNNAYYIEPWLSDYMAGGNAYSDTASAGNKPHPQPMISARTRSFFDNDGGWPYLSMANNVEGVDPAMVLPATNQEGIRRFIFKKWTDNSDTNWAFNPPTAATSQAWPVNEALNFSNSTLKTAAMAGLPVGDLARWNPSRYNTWKNQAATEHANIENWLEHGLSSGVTVQPGVAAEFALSQNYPNPFNPSTRIDYSVPVKGEVSLKVFDVLGRDVATIFQGVQAPGNYVATFDASHLSSGMYFYRLQAGTQSITRKFVLLK